jgi:heptosyltransferase-1
VLTALRRRYPAARIAWVVEEVFAPLLAGHPALDTLIPVATRRWRRGVGQSWGEVAALVRRLRHFAPEVALDLMGNHKAGVLARLAGAHRRIGPQTPDRREPSSRWWINEPAPVAGTHAVDRALSLLAAVDAVPASADFAPEGILPDVAPRPGTPPLLVHPGAGWGNKRYPPQRWRSVLRRLCRATGLEAGVLVGPGEEELAAALAADGVAQAVVAAGIEALVAALRGARLVLGGDSGPVHLAHALGIPVLVLMGPTDPARHGPYRAPERVLARRLPCSYCYRRFAEVKACLLELSPETVAEQALAVLAGSEPSFAPFLPPALH